MIEILLLSYMDVETTSLSGSEAIIPEKRGEKHWQTEELRLFAPDTSQVQSQAHAA